MKPPSVSQLLGVSVLLLSALTVSAVIAYLPPFDPVRLLILLVLLIPYFISTSRMLSILTQITTGRPTAGPPPVVSMEMSQAAAEAQGLAEDYDDIGADVTTEYEF